MKYQIPAIILGDRYMIQKRYKKVFGRKIDFSNPILMTEKMQWLKIYDRKAFYTLCADKLLVRDFLRQFGEDALIPIICQFNSWKDIRAELLPDEPFVLKSNTGCGTYKFICNKNEINWNLLRAQCHLWIANNHYYKSQEWQYKNIKPSFFCEKMLISKTGKLPNDYKLHYINGVLQFIHVNVNDNPTSKYKIAYTPDWKPFNISWWNQKSSGSGYKREGPDIPAPGSLNRMIRVGNEIAKNFKYVRCDFYDVDGQMYYGEITICHGSGVRRFNPSDYDKFYGDMLIINN